MSALDTAAARDRVTAEVRPGGETAADAIALFFEPRAADVDGATAGVREGLSFLGRQGLADAGLQQAIGIVASVARHDLASAFSAWAQRMVIDYLRSAPEESPARRHLPALATAEILGATALAAGTAHVLAGLPLPVSFRDQGDDLILEGRIPWASNLIAPFLVVTAASDVERPGRTLVVAFDDGLQGLEVAPPPAVLALAATGSSTIRLSGVRVPRWAVISEDVHAFVRGLLPRFLLLQSAFCQGLTERSLAEADGALGALGSGIRPELERVSRGAAIAREGMAGLARAAEDGRAIPTRDLLALRLRWSELAREAVHLELATVGGRGYLASSPTARRVREVAFLPVQAPTEVLLRWLLSRSA